MSRNDLTLDLDGWEGPLDLLLALARSQKVDLHQISILALVDQYLDYLKRAGADRLDQAADYLVMAAWLAYLKSCLLLPRTEQESASNIASMMLQQGREKRHVKAARTLCMLEQPCIMHRDGAETVNKHVHYCHTMGPKTPTTMVIAKCAPRCKCSIHCGSKAFCAPVPGKRLHQVGPPDAQQLVVHRNA